MTMQSVKAKLSAALVCLSLWSPAAAQGDRNAATVAEFDGVLKASQEAEITPVVDGWLMNIDFEPGQFVEKGQVLFRFNEGAWNHQNAQTLADLESARAQATLAQIDMDRAATLRQREVVPQTELDAAAANLVIAKQAVVRLEQQIELLKINNYHLSPKAPFAGIMSEPLVEVNGWHSPTYQRRIRMATIKQIDPIWVRAFVSYEDYAAAHAAVEPGESLFDHVELTLVLPDGTEWPHKGRLISSGYEFEEDSQRLVVWGEFQNPDRFLRPGLKVTVRSVIKAGP
jgi:RND family efflux transporter MFP subunit